MSDDTRRPDTDGPHGADDSPSQAVAEAHPQPVHHEHPDSDDSGDGAT